MIRSLTLALAIAGVAFLPLAALAVGTHEHATTPKPGISAEEHLFGVEGDPAKASRTVAISMDDSMRYSLSQIRIATGETVTFVVSNKGKLMHELVIGTEDELKQHAEMMRKHPQMGHEERYMVHVKPGATERMTWRFTKAGTFLFGCLVAGHFEAGMRGQIVVAASK